MNKPIYIPNSQIGNPEVVMPIEGVPEGWRKLCNYDGTVSFYDPEELEYRKKVHNDGNFKRLRYDLPLQPNQTYHVLSEPVPEGWKCYGVDTDDMFAKFEFGDFIDNIPITATMTVESVRVEKVKDIIKRVYDNSTEYHALNNSMAVASEFEKIIEGVKPDDYIEIAKVRWV